MTGISDYPLVGDWVKVNDLEGEVVSITQYCLRVFDPVVRQTWLVFECDSIKVIRRKWDHHPDPWDTKSLVFSIYSGLPSWIATRSSRG